MDKFVVSVVIPVYNAEKYLKNAVESVVSLEEVGEVILVEDASPDNALMICQELDKEYAKVKLFRHPNGENRGAGASRNLGIENSTCNFIAFLDADDWYLPKRFEAEKELFLNNDIDGVYGATGFYVEGTGMTKNKLTTFKEKILPEELLFNLVNNKGRFTTNAITLRKKIFSKSGLFDTSLRLHQDTHLWFRLAHFGNIVAGNIENAVSVRRVHDENRISKSNLKSKAAFRKVLYQSFKKISNVNPIILKKMKNDHLRLRYFMIYFKIKDLFKTKKPISKWI